MKTDSVFAKDMHESSEVIDVELTLCNFIGNILDDIDGDKIASHN